MQPWLNILEGDGGGGGQADTTEYEQFPKASAENKHAKRHINQRDHRILSLGALNQCVSVELSALTPVILSIRGTTGGSGVIYHMASYGSMLIIIAALAETNPTLACY